MVDRAAVRRKYLAERDKRLRPDGNDQYLRLTGRFAHYLDDPYPPTAEREPRTDHRTVTFVGGGFAGLVTGARLREAGVDVRIVEKGGDCGGAWYWNRYPGAQCDTASYVYLPLLAETGHMPTEKYVHGPEILAHCRRIGERFEAPTDPEWFASIATPGWQQRWLENFTANQTGGDRAGRAGVAGPAAVRSGPDAVTGLHTRLLQQRGPGPGPAARLRVGYPRGASAYFAHIEAWRTSGTFEGLEFT